MSGPCFEPSSNHRKSHILGTEQEMKIPVLSMGIHNEVLWIHYQKSIDVKAIGILERVWVYQEVCEDPESNSTKCKSSGRSQCLEQERKFFH